jgi:hypothetical protein
MGLDESPAHRRLEDRWHHEHRCVCWYKTRWSDGGKGVKQGDYPRDAFRRRALQGHYGDDTQRQIEDIEKLVARRCAVTPAYRFVEVPKIPNARQQLSKALFVRRIARYAEEGRALIVECAAPADNLVERGLAVRGLGRAEEKSTT